MKHVYVFRFKMLPTTGGKHFLTIKNGTAVVWALAETIQQAKEISFEYLAHEGWDIASVEDGCETSIQDYNDRPDGLIQFQRAQVFGVSAHILSTGIVPLHGSDNSHN